MAVPTLSTSQAQVDAWNAQMRQSPAYLNYMRSQGLPTDGRVKLSRQQQEGLERALAAGGMRIPGGMHIDQGGNLNQKNTLGRNVAIGAGVTGAALTGFGLAGMGPLGGALGGSGAAAGGAGAAGGILPSSQLAMSPLYTGPIVGGSQGVSAGLGAALQWAAGGVGGDWLDPTRPPSGGNIKDFAQNVASNGLNWWQQAALAGLSGVPSLIAASRNKPPAAEEATQEQIRQMLESQQKRFDYQSPLFQAVSQLAMSRLPTASQRPLAENL